MRCSGCNKFASVDSETEPEVDIDIDEDGNVTGTVRIANTCVECGDDLTEYTFDLEIDLVDKLEGHVCLDDEAEQEKHTLSVDAESSERTDRYEGKGRRAPHFYGAKITVCVTCSCDEKVSVTEEWSDEVQASSMDEAN